MHGMRFTFPVSVLLCAQSCTGRAWLKWTSVWRFASVSRAKAHCLFCPCTHTRSRLLSASPPGWSILVLQYHNPERVLTYLIHNPQASFFSNVAHWFVRQRPHSFVGWCFDVSRERGPAEPRNMLQICTYNPLSASTRQGCRRDLVHSSDKPRDFPDRHQTTTRSLLSGGTNRHAGLIVAVKLDICETWQIREVASPQAGVQGRGGAIRVKTTGR